MLKLYHYHSSTCSKKVRITLAEKGMDWDSHHVNLFAEPDKVPEHLQPWYVKLNPVGVVPTLDHDGRIIIESNIIIEYLDELQPDPSLRPDDLWERAQMRRWLDKAEHAIHRNINIISYSKRHASRWKQSSREKQIELINKQPNIVRRAEYMRRFTDGISEEEKVRALEVLDSVMDEMEATLKEQDWLAGGSYSLADIGVTPFIQRFEVNELAELVDWDARPATGAWWERIKARPSYEPAMFFPDPIGDGLR